MRDNVVTVSGALLPNWENTQEFKTHTHTFYVSCTQTANTFTTTVWDTFEMSEWLNRKHNVTLGSGYTSYTPTHTHKIEETLFTSQYGDKAMGMNKGEEVFLPTPPNVRKPLKWVQHGAWTSWDDRALADASLSPIVCTQTIIGYAFNKTSCLASYVVRSTPQQPRRIPGLSIFLFFTTRLRGKARERVRFESRSKWF